jgi:hypothetical protein
MVDAYQRRKQSTLDAPLRPQGGWKLDPKPEYRNRPVFYRWYGESVVLGNVGRAKDIGRNELEDMWFWRLYRFGHHYDDVVEGFSTDAYTAMAAADAAAAAMGLQGEF